MGRILSFLVVFVLCGSALACLNDEETPTHEREFRSQYLLVDGIRPPNPDRPIDERLLVGGGAVLLIGAIVISARRIPRKDTPCDREPLE